MIFIAWIVICLVAANAIVGVYEIGKPREPYTPTAYLINVAVNMLIVAMCGRILGWW